MDYDAIIHRLLDPTPLSDAELDEQVRACRIDTGTFINFHHPLYVGLLHDDVLGDAPDGASQAERELRESLLVRPKIKAKHEHIHTRPNLTDASSRLNRTLILFERAYRLDAASSLLLEQGGAKDLSRDELREILLWLWTDTEFPSRRAEEWINLFSSLRRQLAPPFGDLSILDGATTVVYRGVSSDDDEFLDDGLSWSTSQTVAAWFARRFLLPGARPLVLVGHAAQEDVWFATDTRGEAEVVSDAITTLRVEEIQP